MDLLGENAGGVRVSRHRAEPSTADRVKVAASAAVAAGALIGSAAQLVPTLANAAPVPANNDKHTADAATAVDEAVKQATAIAAPAPVEASAPVAEAAEVAGQPAPFGLTNLPPEISGPLAQAEQTLKSLQQQFAPPAAARPVAGTISSGFGSRWGAMHYGVDFADTLGAPIHSVLSGTVIEAGPAQGFGLWVRVAQDDGTTAVYGHVNDMLVHEGQRVNAGDVIATVGNRGQSTGPHLHLEIWDAAGNKMDPLPWMASKGVVMQQQWGPGL
ncbi:M23 family metallopeptidase [Nocardia uniformis]|uniref:M23 family metallopeptidase n=2 Tax=Nocardia uniformis TaxID=53432 RepID=A0A849BZM5_9NOCA|nr:M23 family metallopeptidase [Nocardia uniformis]